MVVTQYMHDHNDIGIRVIYAFFLAVVGVGFNNLSLMLISYPMNPWYNEKKEKVFWIVKRNMKRKDIP